MTADERRRLAREAREGFVVRRGGAAAIAARAAFARAVWNADGGRRLPNGSELDRALKGLKPAELEWLCEFAPLGPLYFLPTTVWIDALARQLRALIGARVLEVGAGLGLITREITARGREVTALEPDPSLHARAVATPSTAVRINATLASSGVTGPFDTVLYVNVLEHIEDDIAELALARG